MLGFIEAVLWASLATLVGGCLVFVKSAHDEARKAAAALVRDAGAHISRWGSAVLLWPPQYYGQLPVAAPMFSFAGIEPMHLTLPFRICRLGSYLLESRSSEADWEEWPAKAPSGDSGADLKPPKLTEEQRLLARLEGYALGTKTGGSAATAEVQRQMARLERSLKMVSRSALHLGANALCSSTFKACPPPPLHFPPLPPRPPSSPTHPSNHNPQPLLDVCRRQ